jgi:uncharacterized membrane protein
MGWVVLILLIVGTPIAIIVWLGVKATRAASAVVELRSRLDRLESELRVLRRERESRPDVAAAPTVEPPRPAPAAAAPLPPVATLPPIPVAAPPPPLKPPPEIVRPPPRVEEVEERRELPAINWEQFMGVKLFAWIGGLALFLGVAFFVKYSFENNLITPEMRVAIGYVTGAGLLIGGLVMARKNYEVLGLTLCGTGVLVLYANTFAAHGFYHLIGVAPAFALMILVTVVAFLLSVRLDAQVVAVLGLLGGFLTPVLLSTGQDHPLGLFGYIGLLDAGLIAVVSRKRWNYQVLLAAIGTVAMQVAWAAKFFAVEKVFIAMGVFLGFEILFLVAFALGNREEEDPWIITAAVSMAFVPLAFALYLLTFRELGAKPWIIFTFVIGADLGLLTMVLLRGELARAQLAGGAAAFLVLAIWLAKFVTPALLNWALGVAFVFAVLHTVFPVVLDRVRPGAAPMWWGHLFAPVALVLVMIPIIKLPEVSWLLWFCVLALDVVVFGLAFVTASILAVIGALVLTVATMGLWILRLPATLGDVPELLVVVGGFALVFFGIGIFAARRIVPKLAEGAKSELPWTPTLPGDARAQIPAFSAVLPFLLLIMVVLKMPVTNPSPEFGLAMLLVVLLLGVARWTETDVLALVGLVCSVALEYAWHVTRFKPEYAVVPLAWYLAFVVVFTVFPFVFRRAMENRVLPWVVSALAGPAHFALVYRLVKAAWPNPVMGLLPVAFAIPPMLGLLALVRERRPAQLAWFGGATLLFITLIFPIQFERQWITIGWALEGAALLWLWHRVPHDGLRLVGVGLLCAAFARLALNPAVLAYHPRSATAIWNWYLYAYGLVTVALLAGTKLVDDRRGVALLATLGTVLAFLLVNIEIADYFTAPGMRALTFEFSGSFARDMTYSIAWALFALLLLLAGILKKQRAVRYASLALLGVTLAKLFLHDLAHLKQLYRVGALVGVAAVSFLASFLYTKFVKPEGSDE